MIVVETLLEEGDVGGDVLVVGATGGEGLAGVVEHDVEGLGIGTELGTLQIAPLGADGAQRLGVAVGIGDLEGLGERRFVVDIEGDKHKVAVEHIGHYGVCPYGGFHLAAVDAAEAGEVDKHGFALGTGSSHTFFIVGVFGLDNLVVDVKVLGAHRGCEGRDGLAGSAPETGHHIEGEGERHEAAHDADDGHRLPLSSIFVALELEPAAEVGAEEGEDDNPEGEEYLAVEQVPAVGEVGYGEELQGEGQFDEAEHHLQGVHPRAGLRGLFQPGGEEGEEGERQSQGEGEAEHADGRSEPAAAGGGLYKQQADDGSRA